MIKDIFFDNDKVLIKFKINDSTSTTYIITQDEALKLANKIKSNILKKSGKQHKDIAPTNALMKELIVDNETEYINSLESKLHEQKQINDSNTKEIIELKALVSKLAEENEKLKHILIKDKTHIDEKKVEEKKGFFKSLFK